MRGASPAAVQKAWDAAEWAAAHVRTCAGPAFLTTGDGTLIAANGAAHALAGRGELPSGLRALIIDARLKDCVQTVKVSLPDPTGGSARSFEFTLVPVPVGHLLAIGRETTLESNLIAALAASRDLFRDLALCFTDFAFETDADGVFSWVSPSGLLGYGAAELHGARPRDVFLDLTWDLFSTRERIFGREIWLTSKAGTESCLVLTASPVIDVQGVWRGVRGVARDVTAMRLMEREAAHAKRRDDLIAAVVGAIRAQVEPRRMMLAAADALAAATESNFVMIRALNADALVKVGGTQAGLSHAIEVATHHHGKPNGNIRLAREAAKGAFGEMERALVDAIVPHLGIALALMQSLDAGASARRDVATGLLTRRWFLTEANRRLAAAARAGREVSLLVFDCDHLEDKSELPGQATGDEFTALIGRSLGQAAQDGDIAGRLDDEAFAVLLDNASNALSIGETLCADLLAVCRELGVSGEVGISVGCAIAEPEAGETLEDLFGRAECALHAAKREGRNRVVLAQPAQRVTLCSNG
jgi:diguanylate cyclase (GGDEF)-like protein/PAS domain S-box-containing protein